MAEFPPPELLNELERRLLEPPECLPGCASIPRARVAVSDDDMLQLRLEVNVSQAVAVPLPGRAGHWEPQLITVDEAVPPLARTVDGTLHVVLEPGAYSLILRGTVSGANAVQLHFPLVPRRLDAQLDGWDITGFRRPGVP